MLNEQAERELNKIVTSAYEEGFKSGQKSARAERTKELNALDKQLENTRKEIAAHGDKMLDLVDDIMRLAGNHAIHREDW